ncbi:hypothetical protein B0H11DRAFT_1942641 [Mycena galericulata]|nr:hypothetical protein B0H11DRAFT_1942641 [Mycena galericulata]
MQFSLVASALALSFASSVAAQTTGPFNLSAAPTGTPVTSNAGTPDLDNEWAASRTPMIVGVTFGCIAGTLLVVGGILFYLRRCRIRAGRAPAVIASNPFPIQMDRTDSDARALQADIYGTQLGVYGDSQGAGSSHP